MGADRRGGARPSPGRAVAYAALGAVLLAGCASMPDSGDLKNVESTPRQDTGVRVFAMPPAEGAGPAEIMQGFLEALTSDDPGYDTARKYLASDAARTWRPEQSTTVLAGGPSIEPGCRAGGSPDLPSSITCVLAGSRVATVDGQQAYQPVGGSYRTKVHLTRNPKDGQWRIDKLPDGVVMGKSDFQRNYTSVDKYYFASDTVVRPTGQPVAVADPVFVRSKVDPMTQMVRSLLAGPSRWLGPVVTSSFPTGTALQKDASGLAPDDQNKLTVPLNLKDSQVTGARCTQMATQVLFTLRNLAPTLESVELQDAGRHRLCDLSEERAESAAWHGSAKSPDNLYYLDGKHRLVRMPTGSTTTTSALAVPGPLGEGEKTLESVAVSRDEHYAAGVGDQGRSLYVTSLTSGASLGSALVSSQGPTAADRLTTPSWDARGDLWVADRDPRRPRLYVLGQGASKPEQVAVPDLSGHITDARVAGDGARIALVVEKDGKQSLLIGRIQRDDGTGQGTSVVELRSAAPDLEQVSALSWAGDSRLLVVGREQGGVLQMRYVQVDGSTLDGPAPGGLPGVKAIAASEDERVPLVAYSDDGIVRLPSGAQWQKVDKDGTAPVYPG
ncbi:LpqB family beta-propeller domain-containing protein [Streptomyces yokosukanensis]|uniref:LpqB family beta-propeller domain-containing protein n=1 Tax=Streptomyces yokosukanensis TaxID=67386 RepID=UPI000B0BDD92|nr:LpqB family beta-propeller domain-containing protein [Streptomyces yokosukanensis]